jgi:hypothetical protein
VSGEIITFLFLRTLTDSGLSEVEASGSFSFSKFSKITSRNKLLEQLDHHLEKMERVLKKVIEKKY